MIWRGVKDFMIGAAMGLIILVPIGVWWVYG